MIPLHRGNLDLSNTCLKHLLDNSDLNIVVIDDFGNDEEYVQNSRISFIHNAFKDRRSLAQLWNQCIKACPTDNVIIASWRQRPTSYHFKLIKEKLQDEYGMVTFDGLHFFGFNKYLTTVLGFFDEGLIKGQFEDTDWFNRLKTNNIAMYMGAMDEQRISNGKVVNSMWLEGAKSSKKYYMSKWIEDAENKQLIQLKEEVNLNDRSFFKGIKPIQYRPWRDSILMPNIENFYTNLYPHYIKKF